jgi:periplasmic protein TonB
MASDDASAEGPTATGSERIPGPPDTAALGRLNALDSAAPLHPRWLRPTVASFVVLAHGLALVALANVSRTPPPAEQTIEVNVVAAGDEAPVTTSAAQPASEAANQTSPEPGKAPNEPAPQPPAPDSARAAETPPAVTALTPAAPPPPAQEPPTSVEAQIEPLPPPPDVPPPAVAALTPAALPPPPVEQPAESSPAPRAPPNPLRNEPQPRAKPQAKLEQPERSKPDEKPEKAERAKPRKPVESGSGGGAKASAAMPGSAEAHHVGEANGQTADIGMARASYAALVVAQIQAHKFYPESARSRGEQGAVGVSFTIGPSGRVGSASVVRSSGFADLDGAARDILHSIAPPPPPGGSFSASTTIRFHFE